MEEINHYYDAGSLSVYDTNPILPNDLSPVVYQNYKKLISLATTQREQQKLINATRTLAGQYRDYEINDNEIVLPEPLTEFPRFKRLPEGKIMTKWEAFAKKKGIKKKNKGSKMVYSEEVKDWVPRHGKVSIKKIREELDIIREAKPGDEYADVFKQSKQEKRVELKKQKLNEQKNDLRKRGFDPERMIARNRKGGNVKEKLTHAIKNAEFATASMGKFNYKDNKEIVQKKLKKKGDKPVFKSAKEEHGRNKDVLKRVLAG